MWKYEPTFFNYEDLIQKYPAIHELDFNNKKFLSLLKYLSSLDWDNIPENAEEFVEAVVNLHKNDWVVDEPPRDVEYYNDMVEEFEISFKDENLNQEKFNTFIKLICQYDMSSGDMDAVLSTMHILKSEDWNIHKFN